MAIVGTTIFSHILPVILGFFAVILIISGSLDENKPEIGFGVVLFVIACILPYFILRMLI